MILLLILAFFTTFYNGSDNAGFAVGTEDCHVGYEYEGTVGFFANC